MEPHYKSHFQCPPNSFFNSCASSCEKTCDEACDGIVAAVVIAILFVLPLHEYVVAPTIESHKIYLILNLDLKRH